VPLTAIVEGETVIGPDLSGEEWDELKLRHKKGLMVTMACCGGPGHLRLSKKGTQHFYHAVDTGCTYEQESREHLEIKYRIYRACKAEGWETYVEYPAPDRTWISDVYAARDGRKIVFEIQLSAISPEVLEERERKYRDKGIESYWLLENFLDRSLVFASWYDACVNQGDERHGDTIPYLDPFFFSTGTENQIFIAKGIRSIGLKAKNQTLFSTNNPEIPLAVWVREVLKGNYQRYLDESAAAFQQKHFLKGMAAPALLRFRYFYHAILRDKVYRNNVDRLYRPFRADTAAKNDPALQRKFKELYAEIDWLENEYRVFSSESAGFFSWEKLPGQTTPRPVFRPDSAVKIKKLQECVDKFTRWETSFTAVIGRLERDLPQTTSRK
jgi:competence protein CoiA